MRTVLLLLLGSLVALVLTPAALVGWWASQTLTDTDDYVAAVAPLADDPEVQQVVADQVGAAIRGRLPDAPPGAAELGSRAAARVVASPLFPPAWERANRVAHRQVTAFLEGDRPPPVDDQGRVRVDLSPVSDQALQVLVEQDLVDRSLTERVRPSLPVADVEDVERARQAYRLVDTFGWAAPLAWAVAVAAGLVVSRRRLSSLVTLSVATALGAGLVLLGVVLGGAALAGATERAELAQLGWDALTAGLRRDAVVVGVAGVVVAVAAAIGVRVQQRG